MNPSPNNTILNGPNGELTMAFKDAQNAPNNPNNQNFRPQLQRLGQQQQFQGQPRPFQPGPPTVQQGQPIFRPPQNYPQQQPRFGPPGHQAPSQGQPGAPGQPLFRPQQRFVAVNPPGTVRPNFRPPGQSAQPGPPGQQQQLRPRGPNPSLQQQQSFGGTLPSNKSQEGELQRSQTLETDTVSSTNHDSIKEKEEAKPQQGIEKMPSVESAKSPSPQPQIAVQPLQPPKEVQNAMPSPLPTPMPPQQVPQPIENNIPPNTLLLHNSIESKNSSSSSPQPESVIEVKAKEVTKPEEKAKSSTGDNKPPRVPKTPTRGGGSTARTPSRNKKEGDNDSGVDESTQGNDHSANGDHSPRKTVRNSGRLMTPTKNRSFSRGSRSPMMSPDSQPGTPGPNEKKKLPMNKVQVGSAPSPNLKVVKSKIGSLANASHKPGGGHIKIETKKIDVSHATSRIGAKNDAYSPSGGDKKIISQKLQWSAKSKIGSLENATHKPKGGDKKIETVKLAFKDKAKPKVGSKDNIQYTPGGGEVKNHQNGDLHEVTAKGAKDKHNEGVVTKKETDIDNSSVKKPQSGKILDRKLKIQAESKIGSLDNVKHKPGGGEKKIFDDKEYLRQMSAGGMSNENNSMCGSQNSLPSQHSQHSDSREPVSDENLNREN